MMSKVLPQKGIYFKDHTTPSSHLGLVFLEIPKDVDAEGVGRDLECLWKCLNELNSATIDMKYEEQFSHEGTTTLIGYGKAAFEIGGALKKKPKDLMDWYFQDPSASGGEISKGSRLYYSNELRVNRPIEDSIVLQFISSTQSSISRNIVETYRCLQGAKLHVSRFYNGFRDSERNWMGFYDGISNLRSKEREQVIFIQKTEPGNDWLVNGTYLIFLRIAIDLRAWWKTTTDEQEIMVGREKSTGCPITRLGSDGKPIIEPGCPVAGSKNVIDVKNKRFREYSIGTRPLNSSHVDRLSYSHVQSSKNSKNYASWDSRSLKIFRQGFEFLEPLTSGDGFIAGLNFISFQNTPARLFGTLMNWQKGEQVELEHNFFPGFNAFLKVQSAGVFIVPPVRTQEIFPGSSIFVTSK